jgi:hypothetical protein
MTVRAPRATLWGLWLCGACGAAPSDGGGGSSSGGAAGSSSGTTGTGGSSSGDVASTGAQTSSGAGGSSSEGSSAEGSSSGGGEDNGSEAGGTTGEPQCPAGDGPPGPAMRKFDVVTFSCGMMAGCPADDDQCFCSDHFDALDVGPAHYLATGTDAHKAQVWAGGNFQAVYVDDLNTGWHGGGQARADAIMTKAETDFDCGVPQWFVVNEISAGAWPDDADYRAFVIDFATAMDLDYDKQVVIAAPFDGPGAHASDWAALAEHAFVAAEAYLSGHEINMNGNSVSWCTDRYQETIDAYDALGVGLDRLFLIEHFGQTTADKGWGRAGVSVAGWHNAIEARAAAAGALGFAGFISYAWSWNLMHETDENRLAFEATYVAQPLP